MSAKKGYSPNRWKQPGEQPRAGRQCDACFGYSTTTRAQEALSRAYTDVLAARSRQDEIKACGRWFAAYGARGQS